MKLVGPTTLHYVFTYRTLEGGTSLFAHALFGERAVAGASRSSFAAAAVIPLPARTSRARLRTTSRRTMSSARTAGHRAGLVRRDRARDARRDPVHEHPHDAVAGRRDPRPDQRQGSEAARAI